MVKLLKIKRRNFFSTRQHSYFGVTHFENQEVLEMKRDGNGNSCKDLFVVYLQPSVNKNS